VSNHAFRINVIVIATIIIYPKGKRARKKPVDYIHAVHIMVMFATTVMIVFVRTSGTIILDSSALKN
jgi:hypothetical protein